MGIIVFLNEPLFIYCNLIAIKFDLEFGFYFFLFSLLLNWWDLFLGSFEFQIKFEKFQIFE